MPNVPFSEWPGEMVVNPVPPLFPIAKLRLDDALNDMPVDRLESLSSGAQTLARTTVTNMVRHLEASVPIRIIRFDILQENLNQRIIFDVRFFRRVDIKSEDDSHYYVKDEHKLAAVRRSVSTMEFRSRRMADLSSLFTSISDHLVVDIQKWLKEVAELSTCIEDKFRDALTTHATMYSRKVKVVSVYAKFVKSLEV